MELEAALTVSQVNRYLKDLIEGDPVLSTVAVEGEISNFKRQYPSGHLYFSLKDAEGQLRCVMFRSAAETLTFEPKNGDAVRAYGRISVYPRDGSYQLYCFRLLRSGAGALWEQYEKLKKKLTDEGLFDPARKRPLPAFPKAVGVITSRTGAAVRDMISILKRRCPSVQIVFSAASVQGAEAPGELRAALRRMQEDGQAEVILIGRGGGSAEDLWAFNDEALCRDIAACRIPVISCVGHETDFTLADFAADCRAPTPSAAAELAVPDAQTLMRQIASERSRLLRSLESKLADRRQWLDSLAGRPVLTSPTAPIEARRADLAHREQTLREAIRRIRNEKATRFSELSASLAALDPLSVLSRGYSFAADEKGKTVMRAKDVVPGETLFLRFCDGTVKARAEEIKILEENRNAGKETVV
ncbi:MAG: exodeoxyribonuclease VII large subunit [Clostridia bacterium]|nr:exodeoxyribonuclease VII large subunit [Clostridia bacterium]